MPGNLAECREENNQQKEVSEEEKDLAHYHCKQEALTTLGGLGLSAGCSSESSL